MLNFISLILTFKQKPSHMKIFKITFHLLLGAIVVACSTNPFTGKQTLALVPNSQILPMAFQQYQEFLSENKVVKNTADAQMVKSVGQKLLRLQKDI